jgi:hypothetical protein
VLNQATADPLCAAGATQNLKACFISNSGNYDGASNYSSLQMKLEKRFAQE